MSKLTFCKICQGPPEYRMSLARFYAKRVKSKRMEGVNKIEICNECAEKMGYSKLDKSQLAIDKLFE